MNTTNKIAIWALAFTFVGLIGAAIGHFIPFPGWRWTVDDSKNEIVMVHGVCPGRRPSANNGKSDISLCSQSLKGKAVYVFNIDDRRIKYELVSDAQDGYGSSGIVSPDGTSITTRGHQCELDNEERIPVTVKYVCGFHWF